MLINYNILSPKTNVIWCCYYLCSDKFINHNDLFLSLVLVVRDG